MMEGAEAKQADWREYVDHHNTSGWIINDQSDPTQRDLSFPLEAGVKNGYKNMARIVVMFLKSYEGMGIAELTVCDDPTVLVLDGLYKDYQTNRVSLPTMISTLINDHQSASCLQLPVEERMLVIRYKPQQKTALDRIRRHEKVKILSVEVCWKAVI
jgi:hypothetical protein